MDSLINEHEGSRSNAIPIRSRQSGGILYNAVCEILAILSQRGPRTYSSNTKLQVWTKRYGVTADLFNFEESSQRIADSLSQRVKVFLGATARILRADLSSRYRNMRWTLNHSLVLKNDKRVDDMFRRYEFADAHSDDLKRTSSTQRCSISRPRPSQRSAT